MYWLALCRDIPFRDFGNSPIVQQAAGELKGTAKAAFRGPTAGDLAGPYISQFLARPVDTLSTVFEQRYRTPLPSNDYGTSFGEWLQLQNGVPPWREYVWDPTPRYLRNGRDLAEYIHYDFLFQAFLNAALILLNYRPEAILNENRPVLNELNPYKRSKVEDGFATFGLGQVLKLARAGDDCFAEGDVGAEVAGPPAVAAGGVGRQGPSDADGGGRVSYSPGRAGLGGCGADLSTHGQLPFPAGLPGSFADSPLLPGGTCHGGRGLLRHPEGVLR